MKTTLQALLIAGILVVATASPALGQNLIVEPIPPITVVPGQVVDLTFPNEFDIVHEKRVTFEGSATSIGASGQPTEFSIRFDWLDPLDPNDPIKFSPAFLTLVPPPGPTHLSLEYIIPFCPPQVSIEFSITSGEPVVVQGTFTHECLSTVPDGGSTTAMLVFSATALGFAARRFQNRRRLVSPA